MSFQPNEFFWDNVSIAKKITTTYKMKIGGSKLNGVKIDYFNYSSPIVSESFVDFCRVHGVNAQFVPVDMETNGGKTHEKYFFILLNDFVSIVDVEKSTVNIARDKNTGVDLYEPNFPGIPIIEKIDRLVLREASVPSFFMAPEVGGRVCVEKFKRDAEAFKLTGMKFEELTMDFKYDPFSFLS